MEFLREGLAPDEALAGVVEEDASHAHFGCVGGAQQGGFLWHDLSEVGWTVAQAGGQSREGADVVPQSFSDAHPMLVGTVQGQLEGAEQASGARYGHGHESELAQDPLPLLVADALRFLQLVEDGGQGLFAMRRQFDGLPHRVDYPAQDDLPSVPAAFAFEQLLQGDRLQAGLYGLVRGGQHLIDGVEEVPSQGPHLSGPALAELDEVIHEHVRVPQGLVEGAVGSRRAFFSRAWVPEGHPGSSGEVGVCG